MITEENIKRLQAPLPEWAIKTHPTKTYLSVISPMAVIDRLNEVFGMGTWQFTTEYISCDAIETAKGKTTYMSAVKGRLTIPGLEIVLEQYGGSTNEDKGDALKGGGTDALTKIASYLGVGAEIYKGKGNIAPQAEKLPEEPVAPLVAALQAVSEADTVESLQIVQGQVNKSKKLTTQEKADLTEKIMNKLQTLDPIN